MRTPLKTSFLAVILMLTAQQSATAAGFAIRTESPSGLATSYGGISAGSDGNDISTQYFNPATLSLAEGTEVYLGNSLIIGNFKPTEATATTAASTPVNGIQDVSGINAPASIPSFYATFEVAPELKAGLSVTVPWGLSTSYDDRWVGRYYAVTSSISSLNINPALAWQATDWLSLGAGVEAQYFRARLTNAVDCGTLLSTTPGTIASDCFADQNADGWGYGYNLGALVDVTETTRVGVGYRSLIRQDLEGQVRYSNVPGPLSGLLSNQNLQSTVKTPALLSAGISQDITPQWNVGFDVQYTFWDGLKELRLNLDGGQTGAETTNYENTWFFGLGTTYAVTEEWALKAGLGFDGSPVTAANRSPRLPDGDRRWVSVGSTYKITNSVDIGANYLHGFVNDSNVDQLATQANNAAAFRGAVSTDYSNRFEVISANVRLKF